MVLHNVLLVLYLGKLNIFNDFYSLTCISSSNCITCKDAFYLSGSTCAACHVTCKTCSGPTVNDCTSCFTDHN